MLSGNGYTAKFNRQDVQNVAPENAVNFIVTATATHNGQTVLFEGADAVKVIK